MDDRLTVHRLATGPWAQNCYVLSAGRDAVVLDPGAWSEQVLEYVAASRLRVHAVLATHGHYDHVGAVPEITVALCAPFAIHSDDVRTLSRVNLYRYALHRWGPIQMPQIELDLATTPHLRFGELQIEAVHTPGHTPGSVCLETGGVLFTGDTLLTSKTADVGMRESDLTALRASVRRLSEAYPDETVIYPGHGDSGWLGEAAIDDTLPRGGPAR